MSYRECIPAIQSVLKFPRSNFRGNVNFTDIAAIQLIIDSNKYSQKVLYGLDFVLDDFIYGCCYADSDCDDSNLCTSDYCDRLTGCYYDITAVCDDSNPCTVDSCDGFNGCVFTPIKDPSQCEMNGCSREFGWCDGVADIFLQTNCGDGDALLDGVCYNATGSRGVKLSTESCSHGWPNDLESRCPTFFVPGTTELLALKESSSDRNAVEEPLYSGCDADAIDFCTHPDAHLSYVDCDDDGLLDAVCENDGARGIVSSSRDCESTWPDAAVSDCYDAFGACSLLHHPVYQSFSRASCFGDPHFVTHDGSGFHYYGVGAYTLLRSEEYGIELQIRMFRIPDYYPAFTGQVAVRVQNDVFTFSHDGLQLNALRNGDRGFLSEIGTYYFGSLHQHRVDVSEEWYFFSLENGEGLDINLRAYTITDMWRGIDLQYVLVKSKLFFLVEGLLGDFDGDSTNDFLYPDLNGTVQDYGAESTVYDTKDDWASLWLVEESLFYPFEDSLLGTEYTETSNISAPSEADLLAAQTFCGNLYDAANDSFLYSSCVVDGSWPGGDVFLADYAMYKTCTNDCNFRGTCLDGDICVCAEGWSGPTCEVQICDCRNNGVCNSYGFCECPVGHLPPDCSELADCSKYNNCTDSLHGTCVDNDQCKCNAGFTGPHCGVRYDLVDYCSMQFDAVDGEFKCVGACSPRICSFLPDDQNNCYCIDDPTLQPGYCVSTSNCTGNPALVECTYNTCFCTASPNLCDGTDCSLCKDCDLFLDVLQPSGQTLLISGLYEYSNQLNGKSSFHNLAQNLYLYYLVDVSFPSGSESGWAISDVVGSFRWPFIAFMKTTEHHAAYADGMWDVYKGFGDKKQHFKRENIRLICGNNETAALTDAPTEVITDAPTEPACNHLSVSVASGLEAVVVNGIYSRSTTQTDSFGRFKYYNEMLDLYIRYTAYKGMSGWVLQRNINSRYSAYHGTSSEYVLPELIAGMWSISNITKTGYINAQIDVICACPVLISQFGGGVDVSGIYEVSAQTSETRALYERKSSSPKLYLFYKSQYGSSGWIITDTKAALAQWTYKGGYVENQAKVADDLGELIWHIYDGIGNYTNETITVACLGM